MATLQDICDALEGKVRGKPVGISLFYDSVPPAYDARQVDPCAIVRLAMDDEDLVHFTRESQDCLAGAFTAGVHEGTEEIRNGQYLAKNISAYTDFGAQRIKSGDYILPQNMVVAIGAGPLDKIPDDVKVDWLVVVCTPYMANFIGGARTVLDGTPPRGAAGISFCSELFATPWHYNNVIITPGDIGGRMNNKLRPEEMFVIVPMEYADSMIKIVTDVPDAKAIYEHTRPDHSDYWKKQKAKEERQKANHKSRAAADHVAGKPEGFLAKAKGSVMRGVTKLTAKVAGTGADMGDLPLTMHWNAEAEELIRKTPKPIIEMAIEAVEDFAQENGHEEITADVIYAQMEQSGMDPKILLG